MVIKASESEWPGRWSLSTKPDQEVAGILRLTPPLAMRLDLIGAFPEAPRIHHQWTKPIVAHGVTVDGDEVTIELTHDAGTGHSGFGMRKSYGVRRVIKGDQLPSLDPAVMSVQFTLSHLHDWAQPTAFHCDSTFEEFPFGAKHVLEYREPPPITLIDQPAFALHLLFSGALPFANPRARSESLRSYCWFRIDSVASVPLTTLLPLVGRLRALLSFATGAPNTVDFLEAFPNRSDDASLRKRVDSEKRLAFFPVDTVEKQIDLGRVLHPVEMLFTLSADQEQSLAATRSWLDRWATLGPFLHLYLGATQSRDAYQEHAFLSLVQALEGLHRATASNYLVPRAQHRERIKRILTTLAAEDREFVKSGLQYSNEPSLRHRLDELLKRALSILPGFVDEPKSLLRKAVATRHYFSHFAPGLRGKAADSWELLSMVRTLSTVFEVLALAELGWKEDAIRREVDRWRHNRRTHGIIRFLLEDRWGKA